jgi:uncharacterized protein (DUF427 family)
MPDQRDGVRIEDGPKRVRSYLGGEVVADTTRPKLVWEIPYYPAYYFPREDVRMELLTPNGRTRHSTSRGEARNFTVKGGNREAEDAAWHYPESPVEELRGLIRFDWDAMDGWFEEDEEVFVHPHDPYSRIDILHSSRHVEIEVNGVTVADTHQPTLLFETGLPTRYYVPKVDVRLDLLTPTDKTTGCAYKGFARYWTVEAGDETFEDLAWSYRTPLPEAVKIAGLVAFFNEKVDIIVDGERQERPKTHFS